MSALTSTPVRPTRPARRTGTGGLVPADAARAPEPARVRAARPLRLGPRDVAILGWLGRHRFATASQVARRFGGSPMMAGRRLRQLQGPGYVRRLRPFNSPSVYLATLTGLGIAESELGPARVDLRTYRHDLGLADLAIEFELVGLSTVSEREMRMREGRSAGPYAVRFSPAPREATPRLHFPDLAIEHGDGRLDAFELELTPKHTARLVAILKAYRRSPHVASLVYYVERPELARRLEGLAVSLHLASRLEIRRW